MGQVYFCFIDYEHVQLINNAHVGFPGGTQEKHDEHEHGGNMNMVEACVELAGPFLRKYFIFRSFRQSRVRCLSSFF